MARRDVIEIICDRCERTETQTSVELPKSAGPEFVGEYHGEKVTYSDLCKKCREAVQGYFSRILKKAEEAPKPATSVPAAIASTVPADSKHEPKEEPKKRSFLGGLGGK